MKVKIVIEGDVDSTGNLGPLDVSVTAHKQVVIKAVGQAALPFRELMHTCFELKADAVKDTELTEYNHVTLRQHRICQTHVHLVDCDGRGPSCKVL